MQLKTFHEPWKSSQETEATHRLTMLSWWRFKSPLSTISQTCNATHKTFKFNLLRTLWPLRTLSSLRVIDNIKALSCRRILGQLKRLAIRCKDLQTSRSCITIPLLSLAFSVSNPGTHVLLRAFESRQEIRVKLEKPREAVAPEVVFVKACRYGRSDHSDYSSRWVPNDDLLSLWAKQSIDWSWFLVFLYPCTTTITQTKYTHAQSRFISADLSDINWLPTTWQQTWHRRLVVIVSEDWKWESLCCIQGDQSAHCIAVHSVIRSL